MFLKNFLSLVCVKQKLKGNRYKALCPAHEDKEASLSISEGQNKDRILIHCHAGCSLAAVLSSLRLRPSDLWYSKVKSGVHRKVPVADAFFFTQQLEKAGKKTSDLTLYEYYRVLEECLMYANFFKIPTN